MAFTDGRKIIRVVKLYLCPYCANTYIDRSDVDNCFMECKESESE